MILSRVPVPVAFDNLLMVGYILIAIILIPAFFSLLVALILNRKAEKETRSYFKPFVSGLGSGLLLAVLAATLAYATVPYLKAKEAFTAVSDYYDTNIITDGSRLPVYLHENSERPDPIPATVYRVAGGNPESCSIYIDPNDEYVLYCDGREFSQRR